MLRWIPVPSRVRRLRAICLKRLRAWREEWQIRRRIEDSAAPVIERLGVIKSNLPTGVKLTGILLTEHFGDIVACEPVIPWLRSQHSADFLVWLTRPDYSGLLKQHPVLDAVMDVGSISVCGEIIRSGVLDRVVDLHLHRKPCTVFGRYHIKRTGNPDIDTENYYHHGTLLEAMSVGAGLPRLDGQPHLVLPVEARKKIDSLGIPSGVVVIHARSNEQARNWDCARWNELAEKLVSQFGLTVVEIGLDPVLTANRKGVMNLCGQLSLIESAETVRRAAYFFGIDSGPAHFANAFEIPSVILLGLYRDFDRYMPFTGFLRNHAEPMIIQCGGPAAEITVAEVLRRFEAVRRFVPTVPDTP